MEEIKIYVYGTLKKGERAHYLLEGAKFIGITVVPDIALCVFSHATFPGAMLKEGCQLECETYLVSSDKLAQLDIYEGVSSGLYSHYKYDNGIIYLYNQHYVSQPPRLSHISQVAEPGKVAVWSSKTGLSYR